MRDVANTNGEWADKARAWVEWSKQPRVSHGRYEYRGSPQEAHDLLVHATTAGIFVGLTQVMDDDA